MGNTEITVEKEKKKGSREQAVAACIVILAVIALAAIWYVRGVNYYSSHFFPNTTIAGTQCGDMTLEEAQAAVSDALAEYTLTVYEDGDGYIITAEDVGLAYESLDGIGEILEEQENRIWPAHKSVVVSRGQDFTVKADEEKLEEAVSSLPCFTREEVEPEDAYIAYDDTACEYVIIPETEGNIMDRDAVTEAVSAAVVARESSVDISGFLTGAEITADDEALNEAADTLNTWISAGVTYKDGGVSVSVSSDDIRSFIVIDGSDISLDEDEIYGYITANVSSAFNTVGTSRTINTPSSGTVTVSGGTYGYDVWRIKEIDALVENIEAGEAIERTPVYYQEGYGRNASNDVGDTYIDINLSAQEVYLVQDGTVAFSTSCVSGCVSNGTQSPTGLYQIENKVRDYIMVKYDTFVYYWMPYDLTNGIGLHDATWRSNFGGSIYQTNGSHGCINLPLSAAKTIYESVSVGMPVIVH